MYLIGGLFNLEGSTSSYRTITEEVLACGGGRVVQGNMKSWVTEHGLNVLELNKLTSRKPRSWFFSLESPHVMLDDTKWLPPVMEALCS